MPRRVFFSFKFDDDIFRVNTVRKINQFETSNEFHDHASHEKVMRESDENIKRWINNQLNGASVTCVLIGQNTFDSKWVKYEIEQSYKLGMGILAIHIHDLKCMVTGKTSSKGKNPLNHWSVGGRNFSDIYRTYDPINHVGAILNDTWCYNTIKDNAGAWIEAAAKQANR